VGSWAKIWPSDGTHKPPSRPTNIETTKTWSVSAKIPAGSLPYVAKVLGFWRHRECHAPRGKNLHTGSQWHPPAISTVFLMNVCLLIVNTCFDRSKFSPAMTKETLGRHCVRMPSHWLPDHAANRLRPRRQVINTSQQLRRQIHSGAVFIPAETLFADALQKPMPIFDGHEAVASGLRSWRPACGCARGSNMLWPLTSQNLDAATRAWWCLFRWDDRRPRQRLLHLLHVVDSPLSGMRPLMIRTARISRELSNSYTTAF